VLAIVAASPALAQTTVLTSSSPNYDLLANAGVDSAVELSSGTNGYFILGDSHSNSGSSGNPQAAVPAGGVGILSTVGGYWQYAIGHDAGSMDSNWILTNQNVPMIKVDSGATLTFAGSETYGWNIPSYAFYSMVQATGDVTFGAANWTFWANNSFGNVTLLNGAKLQFGGDADQNGWNAGGKNPANATISGWVSGSSAADLEVALGTVVVNGVNTAAHPFAGVVNIANGSTLTIGDSTHASAVFGDPTGKTAKINVVGLSGVLAGYGTIDGNVTSAGIIKAGGTSGVNGGLTINGNLTLANTSILKTAMTPTGVSGLTVNGNMTAAGELDIAVASGTYGNGVFPVIAVNGGTLSGSFGAVATSGDAGSAIIGLLKTTSGYSIVTETGSAAQVFGHVVYANRMALTNFVDSLYDTMAVPPASGAKVDVWLTPFGGIENLGRDGLGYEQKTYGVSLGAMHHFERHGGVIGAAFSYRHGNMSVKDDPATAATIGYDLAVYGGADVNELRLEGSAFYNIFSADTKRPMGAFGTSVASQNGYAYGVSGQISHTMFRSLLTPYVRGMFGRNHMEAASESGSLQYDLMHEAINLNTLVVDLGIRAHVLTPLPDQPIKVDTDLAWRYDLSDPGETATVGFANFVSGTSTAYWRGDSKHALVAGVDVAGQVTDRLEIYGRLSGTLTSHRRAGDLSAGVKYRF
jgi:hypothetical protein